MVQGPPSSDSEPENPDNPDEYEYESEGEQVLSQRARELFRASSGDYRRKLSPELRTQRPPDPDFSGTGRSLGIHPVMMLLSWYLSLPHSTGAT